MEAAGAGAGPSLGLSAAGQQLHAAQLPDIPDLVNIEGDEEVQYVLLELPPEVAVDELHPGAEVVLKDFDTDNPRLQLGGGPELQGSYAEQLGTLMFFRHVAQPTHPEQGSQQQGPGELQSSQGGVTCKFVGLSESRIVFTQPPASVTGQRTGPGTILSGVGPNSANVVGSRAACPTSVLGSSGSGNAADGHTVDATQSNATDNPAGAGSSNMVVDA